MPPRIAYDWNMELRIKLCIQYTLSGNIINGIISLKSLKKFEQLFINMLKRYKSKGFAMESINLCCLKDVCN